MKARKLVKDTFTGKQNIVFFGSYGYKAGMQSHNMILYKESTLPPLLINPDLLINDDLLIQQGPNSITYYNYFYLNLYFQKRETEQFITISSTNSSRFTWLIQFNALSKNENILIQKLGIGREECQISVDDLVDEFGHYEMISNFMIAIILESDTPVLDVFTIDYPTRISKLAYDKTKFDAKHPYTYMQSQEFNYSGGVKGVRDSLIPRLSVIKGELWYKMSYGLPLMEKIRSKGIYDSIIVRYITDHPDITNLEDFTSTLDNHKYIYNSNINTIYGEKINLSNE